MFELSADPHENLRDFEAIIAMRARKTVRIAHNAGTVAPATRRTLGHAELPTCAEECYGMAMPDTAGRWTREMVLALPDDGQRYELFDGQLLVTPAPVPRHQLAVQALADRLSPYIRSHRIGFLLTSPADLDLGGDQLSQPDLFVLPALPPDRLSWRGTPNPVLVVEVLSPGSARGDRLVKRRRFQRAGIPEFWILDLDARVVERWRPQDERPEILDERLEWRPIAAEPLVFELGPLFSEVCGEEGASSETNSVV